MRTPYQEAFDHVTASERLKDEVLDMTKREKQELRRRIPKFILIAAVIVLLLAGTALAVNIPNLQDWFRQYWVEATGENVMNPQQEDVMNSVTQSVDATSNMENGAEDTSSEDTFSEGTLPEAASHGDAPTQKAGSAGTADPSESPAARASPGNIPSSKRNRIFGLCCRPERIRSGCWCTLPETMNQASDTLLEGGNCWAHRKKNFLNWGSPSAAELPLNDMRSWTTAACRSCCTISV